MMGVWGNGYGGTDIMGMIGTVMPLILGIGIILLGIYLFLRNASQVSTGTMDELSGMDIQRERYARDEIDSLEYQSHKQDLKGK